MAHDAPPRPRRTASLHVQLTPFERAEIEAAAADFGDASLSAYIRRCCLRRQGERREQRRLPEAVQLARELAAIGNNLNQLTRLANTHRVLPAQVELAAILSMLKTAIARVIAL